MSRKLRTPSPRIAGSALRTVSAAAGFPVVDMMLASMLRKQLGVDVLLQASFSEDETPFTQPRPLAQVVRKTVVSGGKKR